MKRLLILGAGAQGSTVAKRMNEESNVSEIICADYDETAVKEMEETLEKAKAIKLNARHTGDIVEAAQGVDLIVNALPISLAPNALAAALESKTCYQDFAAAEFENIPFEKGIELMLTYDPTPATWMWQWDAIVREDAPFAASLGFVYRDQPTTVDAFSSFLEDGVTRFVFSSGTPARDLYELRARILSKLGHRVRIVANLYGGTAEPNGDDPREVERFGGDVRVVITP